MKHFLNDQVLGNQELGLFGRFRAAIYIGASIFLAIQFAIVLTFAIQQMGQGNVLKPMRIPAEYLCPLFIALGLIARIGRFRQNGILDSRTTNYIRDWVIALVVIMYACSIDFMQLR